MLGYDFVRVKPQRLLFAGGNQPARRDLGISSIAVEEGIVPVQAVDLIKAPFCTLVELKRADIEPQSNVLLAAPLSGHLPVLLRDLIIGLLPTCRSLPDGLDQHPACSGRTRLLWPRHEHFVYHGRDPGAARGLERDRALSERRASPRRNRASRRRKQPANPGVARAHRVAHRSACESDGRRHAVEIASAVLVRKPAQTRAQAIRRRRATHLSRSPPSDPALDLSDAARQRRRGTARQDLFRRRRRSGPVSFPRPSHFDHGPGWPVPYREHDGRIPGKSWFREGSFRYDGVRVDPTAIEKTALLTIEGELDDIAAPGQTSAAHALCSSLPDQSHDHIVVPGAGHFSLFHGNACRHHVVPAIQEFIGRQ